ncbi:MAG: AraC family transcriptional regulator [Roseibium sp.]
MDVDEARQVVGRNFCSHRLERRSSSDRFDACQNRVAGNRVSLNYIRYGADVTIEPGELSDFYLIQIPVSGHAEVTNGFRTVLSTRKAATILNPDRETRMRWHSGCEKLLLQVDRSYLQGVAERMAGLPLGPVRFHPKLDLEVPAAAAWVRKLRGLFAAADDGIVFAEPGGAHQRRLEEALVGSLLESQPSTVSPLLARAEPCSAPAPAILRRALAVIAERFRDDIGLAEICAEARTTPRNLQLLFKREYGTGPIQYLHGLRLDYARHLLLSDGGNLSIADIADGSGHTHLGRFSAAYKRKFGQTPRETRREGPLV